jgi:hypothetical protein
VAGAVGLATSQRGLTGSISHGWHQLTAADAVTPSNSPDRLTATASVRARYWREAWSIWRNNPMLGVGAGGYDTARTRYRHDNLDVRHAHGYVVQTLSDLGLIGMGISLALLAAWLAAALRATGLRPVRRGGALEPERVGLVTLLAVAVTFGVHSFVDWTWFVPGNAALALLCAGWVAGRGPLAARNGLAAFDANGALAGTQAKWGAAARARAFLPPPGPGRRPRVAGAACVAALALVIAFATWQPLRSSNASGDALSLLSRGDTAAALRAVDAAERRNPLSIDPPFERATIEDAAGHPAAAERALESAVTLQPANPATWLRLAEYQLTGLDRPADALRSLGPVLYLDPRSREGVTAFLLARRKLSEQQLAAAKARAAKRRAAAKARAAKRRAAAKARVDHNPAQRRPGTASPGSATR